MRERGVNMSSLPIVLQSLNSPMIDYKRQLWRELSEPAELKTVRHSARRRSDGLKCIGERHLKPDLKRPSRNERKFGLQFSIKGKLAKQQNPRLPQIYTLSAN
jgi:hypothetical protein